MNAYPKGRNGYCTYLGNELFAWFESPESKSRVDFLGLRRAGDEDYVLNAGALEYMGRHKRPPAKLKRLEEGKSLAGKQDGEAYRRPIGITGPKPVQITPEGALMGSLRAHGFPTPRGSFRSWRIPRSRGTTTSAKATFVSMEHLLSFLAASNIARQQKNWMRYFKKPKYLIHVVSVGPLKHLFHTQPPKLFGISNVASTTSRQNVSTG